MTHLALHHVVVRMLYDPAFVQSVFARPEEALADAGITTEDIDWLLQTDPRAYTTDSHRRARSLGGLLEEYPTACAALVRARHRSDAGTPPVAVLDAFFSSAGFHRGMQAGASLALSFGEYLVQTADGLPRADPAATLRHELAAALARIELRIARLRRIALRSLPAIPEWTDSADSSELERARLHASPCIDWLTVPEGVLDRFGEVRRQLALASSARPSREGAHDTDDGGSVGVGVGVGVGTASAPAGAGDARTAVVD
ncbi:MAG: hypothetical protein KC729_14910, partial [Candidatus Eisenbacteria bacterium]|nr:hypothetical protein [Candidatus Eisenbacteria bacterium]